MDLFPEPLLHDARRVLETCRRAGLHVVTAESCTGGLVAACLTEIPGASDVIERGFVTYSDAAKSDLLGVPPALLRRHGAVSGEVAEAMAGGALARSAAELAVSVTGIAGPDGATAEKPVGLVYLGAARRDAPSWCERHLFPGDRGAVRLAAVSAAFAVLARLAGEKA